MNLADVYNQLQALSSWKPIPIHMLMFCCLQQRYCDFYLYCGSYLYFDVCSKDLWLVLQLSLSCHSPDHRMQLLRPIQGFHSIFDQRLSLQSNKSPHCKVELIFGILCAHLQPGERPL